MRWYFRFQLSLRDIEELLLERGAVVSYETIRRRCAKFGKQFARRVKQVRPAPGTTWHLDEVFVKIDGEPYLLWRAVDQHGAELDILLQKRRGTPAAQHFLSSFGPIRQHFAIKREQLGAARRRSELTRRFPVWHHITGTTQNPSTA